jgi:hypothetical protein
VLAFHTDSQQLGFAAGFKSDDSDEDHYTRANLDEALTVARELHERMRDAEDRTARIVSFSRAAN